VFIDDSSLLDERIESFFSQIRINIIDIVYNEDLNNYNSNELETFRETLGLPE
jgi:hypothetical protein